MVSGPRWLCFRLGGQVHPRFRTPYITTIPPASAVDIPAMFVTSTRPSSSCLIWTLFAFVLVSVGSSPFGARTWAPSALPAAQAGPPAAVNRRLRVLMKTHHHRGCARWWSADSTAGATAGWRSRVRRRRRGRALRAGDAAGASGWARWPSRAYFAYSTVLDPYGVREWRTSIGLRLLSSLPPAPRREGAELGLVYDFRRGGGGAGVGRGSRIGRGVCARAVARDRAEGSGPIIQHKEGVITRMCVERGAARTPAQSGLRRRSPRRRSGRAWRDR